MDDLYSKILDLRKFEIENFWKRTLFFWGTLAIVLIGYFQGGVEIRYLIFISLIGVLYSLIFSLSIRGSKYWQEHWEVMASDFERKNISPKGALQYPATRLVMMIRLDDLL